MVLGLYGGGGFGRETYEMVSRYERDRWDEILFIDDVLQTDELMGASVMPYQAFRQKYSKDTAKIAITQGEPANKKLLYEKVKADGYELAVLVHPHAYVNSDAVLEEGVIVFVGSTISSAVKLGKCVTVLTYGLVGHDAVIGDFCQISAMALVNGHVTIGNESFVGGSACIRDEITIGERSFVSMGACVLKDVPDGVIVMGNPARVIQATAGGRVFEK